MALYVDSALLNSIMEVAATVPLAGVTQGDLKVALDS